MICQMILINMKFYNICYYCNSLIRKNIVFFQFNFIMHPKLKSNFMADLTHSIYRNLDELVQADTHLFTFHYNLPVY